VYTHYKVLLHRDRSGLAQSPTHNAPDAEWPWRADEHSHPSGVEVMNEWNDTSTPANTINKLRLIKRRDRRQYRRRSQHLIHILKVYIRYEKRPLGRPRRRWKDNIKIDL
jgi:hypothetical protein